MSVSDLVKLDPVKVRRRANDLNAFEFEYHTEKPLSDAERDWFAQSGIKLHQQQEELLEELEQQLEELQQTLTRPPPSPPAENPFQALLAAMEDSSSPRPPSPKNRRCALPGCEATGEPRGSTLKCARCKSQYYCSKEHQTAHWSAGHRQACVMRDHPLPVVDVYAAEEILHNLPDTPEARADALVKLFGAAGAKRLRVAMRDDRWNDSYRDRYRKEAIYPPDAIGIDDSEDVQHNVEEMIDHINKHIFLLLVKMRNDLQE